MQTTTPLNNSVPEGPRDELTSAHKILVERKIKGLERVVAVKVNGEVRDLFSPVDSKTDLEPIYENSDEGLDILRHSTSHVMAEAVKELFPGVKVTIGPDPILEAYHALLI